MKWFRKQLVSFVLRLCRKCNVCNRIVAFGDRLSSSCRIVVLAQYEHNNGYGAVAVVVAAAVLVVGVGVVVVGVRDCERPSERVRVCIHYTLLRGGCLFVCGVCVRVSECVCVSKCVIVS